MEVEECTEKMNRNKCHAMENGNGLNLIGQ